MQIGKPGDTVSRISQAYPDRVVRGRDLAGELMGEVTFTEYFHLLLTGKDATEEERYFLDVLLVAIAEHGMMPTNVAARMTLAADLNSLPGRGRCRDPRRGAGRPRHVRGVRRILVAARELLVTGETPEVVAAEGVRALDKAGRGGYSGLRSPGARPLDPRAERILALADGAA